jgi:hypothetical protein|tara:strand:- start:36 stop:290 length:255 start_codon:yes stop_codon:yes gene_type:complete
MMRKYINPKEVNEIYGIKPNTLARQRSGGYGIPFHRLTKPGTMKGIILYNVDDIEEALARAKTIPRSRTEYINGRRQKTRQEDN